MDKIEFVARVAHGHWCSYQLAVGQEFDMDDEDAIRSQMIGVKEWFNNPSMSPRENHMLWMGTRIKQGWVYGKKKDKEKKTHPDLVGYDELPEVERKKDAMDLEGRQYGMKLWQQLQVNPLVGY